MYTNNKPSLWVLIVLSTLLILGLFLAFLLVALVQKKEVTISTNTPDANFKILGVIEGKTPATVKLKRGKYTIEISKEGKKTLTEAFEVPYWGNKTISLNYTLEAQESYINPRAGYVDPQKVKENLEIFNDEFPFKSALPAEGSFFYIDIPFENGQINVYLTKEHSAIGKDNAYEWFKAHGVDDPSRLNIEWILK